MENLDETTTITLKYLLLCNDGTSCTYDIKREISHPADAMKIFNTVYKISRLPDEIFVALFLDAKNGVNGISKITHGTAIMAPVSTRDLFKNALAHNATQLIVAHNHPSGNPRPSEQDIQITDLIARAASFMDIFLVDHIIIGGDQYYSFTENGQLKQYSGLSDTDNANAGKGVS